MKKKHRGRPFGTYTGNGLKNQVCIRITDANKAKLLRLLNTNSLQKAFDLMIDRLLNCN